MLSLSFNHVGGEVWLDAPNGVFGEGDSYEIDIYYSIFLSIGHD